MPQASDELRSKMEEYFGDPVSDKGPIKFLRKQGYFFTRHYEWVRPHRMHLITPKEWECITFLMEEWDWGLMWFKHIAPEHIGRGA